MNRTRAVEIVHETIAEHCEQIAKLFRGPVRITIVVRPDGIIADPTGERDVVVTDDTFSEIQQALTRAEGRAGRSVGGAK